MPQNTDQRPEVSFCEVYKSFPDLCSSQTFTIESVWFLETCQAQPSEWWYFILQLRLSQSSKYPYTGDDSSYRDSPGSSRLSDSEYNGIRAVISKVPLDNDPDAIRAFICEVEHQRQSLDFQLRFTWNERSALNSLISEAKYRLNSLLK